MKLSFQKIYCIHLSNSKKRYESIQSEFKRLGIEDQVQIWWTVKNPILKTVGDNLEILHTRFYDDIRPNNDYLYGAVFDITLNHYTIIKQAYLRGFENIMILEDDFRFIDDISAVEKAFQIIPNDWDVLKFRYGYNNNHNPLGKKTYENEDDLWMKPIDSMESTDAGGYALNRNGMKKMIELLDNEFYSTDMHFTHIMNDPTINYYVTKYVICHNINDESTIETSNNA